MALRSLSLGVTTFTIAILGSAPSASAISYWSGANSTDPGDAGNWSQSPPTIGAVNPEGIWNNSNANIVYASNTTTTFGTSAGQLQGLTWLGQSSTTNTFSATAGTVNFSGAFASDGGIASLWIGNGGGSNAAVSVNGGTINVLNGTLLGRDNSNGTLTVSNGSFTTGVHSALVGMYLSTPFSGGGNATVNIADAGLISITGAAANPLQFGTLTAGVTNTSSSFLNFTNGSTGTLNLDLSSATLGSNYFNNLITNGYTKIGGVVVTDPGLFSINTSNLSSSTLTLIPEPSTYLLTGLGGAAFAALGRRRRTSAL